MYDSYVNLQHIWRFTKIEKITTFKICCKFTYGSYVFFFNFVFLFFCFVYLRDSTYERRVREEAPSHVRTEEFLHTLFRRCNKTASERDCIWYPYTRGSKTPLKKSFFFWNGVPEGSHSRPPGRSKSMVFKRIWRGRKSPGRVAGTDILILLLIW